MTTTAKKPPKQAPVLAVDLDRETQLMARAAYDILEARGAIPRGCNAVWERAAGVQMSAVGFNQDRSFGKCSAVWAEGAPNNLRYCHLE